MDKIVNPYKSKLGMILCIDEDDGEGNILWSKQVEGKLPYLFPLTKHLDI